MSRKQVYLLVILLGLSSPGLYSGESQTSPAPAKDKGETVAPAGVKIKRLADYNIPGLDKKVYLQTLIPWNVVQLVEFLANEGGLKNVVISRGVASANLTTKLTFSGISVADALDVVASVNNLAYEVQSDIITVMTDDEYKQKYGTSFHDARKVRIVDIKYADTERVAKMLENVKSGIGTIVANPVTGSLILIDTPDKIQEMVAIVEKADIPTITRVTPTETLKIQLQYAKLEDIQPIVSAMLTKDIGTMQVDKRTRILVISDLPHILKRIEEVIKLFDTRSRQVFIEAKIVQTTLSDDFSMGINWEHLFDGIDPNFKLHSVVRPGVPAGSTLQLTYNTVRAEGDLQVILEALKAIGETKILSNPHIAVMDGQEATIEVVEEQPYKEIGLESGTTNITQVTYKFKPVGVQLAVTPRVNDEGFITVQIKPQISSITQWYDGAPQEGTPVVRKALAETTVTVRDGVTIIIGGMIMDRKDTRSNQVPVLGSIPLLGNLFKYQSSSIVKTETIVFMTPRIVSGGESFLLERDMKKQPKGLRPVGVISEKQPKPPR
jgi:type II secretory pathway component GspD/PulD (secretin)